MPDTTSMFVTVVYKHDHACRWQGVSPARVYPVWRDGTYTPERLVCADLGMELTVVSRELREHR